MVGRCERGVVVPFYRSRATWLMWLVIVCQLLPGQTAGARQIAPRDALEEIRKADFRVNAVAFRLLTANADLCSRKSPASGMLIHALSDYPSRSRADVGVGLALSRAPGVLAVAPGSPAALAGIHAGDLVVSLNGKELRPSTRSETVRLQLAEAGRTGIVHVGIMHGMSIAAVTIKPLPACGYPVRLVRSRVVNAFANGRDVRISTALVHRIVGDDELAILLAHELAHDLLREGIVELPKGVSKCFEHGSSKEREEEADKLGLYLAARAGFEVAAARPLWSTLSPHGIRALWSDHPGRKARLALADKTIAAIDEAGAAVPPCP